VQFVGVFRALLVRRAPARDHELLADVGVERIGAIEGDGLRAPVRRARRRLRQKHERDVVLAGPRIVIGVDEDLLDLDDLRAHVVELRVVVQVDAGRIHARDVREQVALTAEETMGRREDDLTAVEERAAAVMVVELVDERDDVGA